MSDSNSPSLAQILLMGITKAIPNMVYGNTIFGFILLIRSLAVSGIFAKSVEYFIDALSIFVIIFVIGFFIAVIPAIAGGMILSFWLNKDKTTISLKRGVLRGAVIGALIMVFACTVVYIIYRPHGLPDPDFPFHSITATTISTLAGVITGMQLTREFIKTVK